MARFRGLIACLCALPGCGDAAGHGPHDPPPDVITGCAAGELTLEDGGCLSAGVQANGCAAGELGTDAGCVPAGVAPDGCGEGFVHDGDRGCEPVLATGCAPGTMAAVGEATCHSLMACGDPPWGELPVDASTIHVDQSFTGTSDGSAAAPFTAIQAAIDAAPPGGLVAIAEGQYVGDLQLDGKAVRLWGRCPELVAVVGTAVTPNAPAILVSGADGAELGGLAVTGPGAGIEVRASEDVALMRLWVHDTAWRGVSLLADEGPTSALLANSLVENVARLGVWANGATLEIDASVVRDVTADASGTFGDGIFADPDPTSERAPVLSMSSSLVSRATKIGIFVAGGQLELTASVVSGTQMGSDEPIGHGIVVQEALGRRGDASIRGSLIDESLGGGVVVYGSDVSLESTVVRDTGAVFGGTSGRGVDLEPSPMTGDPTHAVLRQSLIADSREMGLFAASSEVVLEGVAIRDVAAVDGLVGRGINVQPSLEVTAPRPSLTIVGSLVERSHEAGVAMLGADADIDGLWVRDILRDASLGIGVDFEWAAQLGQPTSGVMRSSVIERVHDFGIVTIASESVVEATLVRGVAPLMEQYFGDGMAVMSAPGLPAIAAVRGNRVEDVARVGVASFGASVEVAGTALECLPIALSGQDSEGESSEYSDGGNNVCGCDGENTVCKSIEATLEPPSPIGTGD